MTADSRKLVSVESKGLHQFIET